MEMVCVVVSQSIHVNNPASTLDFEVLITADQEEPIPIVDVTTSLPHFSLSNYVMKFIVDPYGQIEGKVYQKVPLSKRTYFLVFSQVPLHTHEMILLNELS